MVTTYLSARRLQGLQVNGSEVFLNEKEVRYEPM